MNRIMKCSNIVLILKLSFLLLFMVVKGYAQQENVWTFGEYALLDFTHPQNGYPTAGKQSLSATEGCASVCDSNGNLLFYTSGSTVYNRNHDTMLNGDIFPVDRTTSTSQGALIVPMPGERFYYVFSLTQSLYQVDNHYSSLYYSVVDISLDGGLGGIISGKKTIYIDTGFSEQLTSIPGLYGDVWVLTSRHAYTTQTLSDTMYSVWAYNVTAQNGLNTIPVVTTGLPNKFQYTGSLMPSPDYTMLVDTRLGATIYQFDRRRGVPHSPITMPGWNYFDSVGRGSRYYGAAAFSPNSQYLYLTRGEGGVVQFDVSNYDIDSIFHSREELLTRGFDLKLGPDGKIYVIDWPGSTSISTIEQPNEKGANANPIQRAFQVLAGTAPLLNFSNIINMPGIYEVSNSIVDTCIFSWPRILTPTYSEGEFFEWFNGDTTPTIEVNEPGVYWVTYVRGRYYHVDSFYVGDYNKRISIEVSPVLSDCFGYHLGRARVSIIGVSENDFESYWLKSNGDTISGEKRIGSLQHGNYNLIVRQKGCTNLFPITIEETFSSTFFPFELVTRPACGPDSSGYAYLHITDDSAYTYRNTWRLSNGVVLQQEGDTIMKLPSGDYELHIQTEKCDTIVMFSIKSVNDIVDFELEDTIWCQGIPYALANISGSHYEQFAWILNGDTISTGYDWYEKIFSPGIHVIRLAGSGALCSMQKERIITVDSAYQNIFSIDKEMVCQGESIRLYMHTDASQSMYFWSVNEVVARSGSPEHQSSMSFDGPGIHTVQLTTRFRACPDTSYAQEIIVEPIPVVFFGNDSVICLEGSAIELAPQLENGKDYAYEWNTGDSTSTLKITHPGRYSLRVRNLTSGCTGESEINITKDCYINIPNAFSPNGDGINDYFFPRQLLTQSVTHFRMDIYNRWGQLLFTTVNAKGRGWDGRFNGGEQPGGVYIYRIEAELSNGYKEKYEGNVTLLR